VSSVKALSRHFGVPDALVETLFQQADEIDALNFFAGAILRTQASELAREFPGDPHPRIVIARTQPTSPLSRVRLSYAGKEAFGLTSERRVATFDTLFATYISQLEQGGEESINLGGLAPALEKDRQAAEEGVEMGNLSPLQRLSLKKPTEAMFRHAGAVKAAIEPLIPAHVDASQYIFLQGRYEGEEESVFLASPTRTVAIVGEEDYQLAARAALGDEVDIVVEAEGVLPHDPGLERRHDYVNVAGRVISNRVVRELVRRDLPYLLDRYLIAEHRGLGLMLMQGQLRASVQGGKRYEGGQALLLIGTGGELRWFILLNKRNGEPAWRIGNVEKAALLKRLAEAFAMLEATDSTAGARRRQQYEAQRLFNVPMSHPSGRENGWRLASAVRQAGFPDLPLGARIG
jgi:hypothetical protein